MSLLDCDCPNCPKVVCAKSKTAAATRSLVFIVAPVIEGFERVNEISADFFSALLLRSLRLRGKWLSSFTMDTQRTQRNCRDEIQINYMDNDGNRYRNNIHDAADSRR